MASLKCFPLFFFTSLLIVNNKFHMASSNSDILINNTEIIVYRNGTSQRRNKPDFVPPEIRVISKDLKIPPQNIVSARLYKPIYANRKLPFLIHTHGGGFCFGSAFAIDLNSYLNYLAAEANVVAAAIEYRLAPEHPIPACYDDAWSALKWFISTSDEPWLNEYVDFSRIFVAGDSAGANIAHYMMVRASLESNWFSEKGARIAGLALVHPFFGGSKMTDAEYLWLLFCPNNSGLDDYRLNPAVHQESLKNLICNKILVCIAEDDGFKDRGLTYYQAMKKSNWPGQIQLYESKGEVHEFHLKNLTSEKAIALMKKIASFVKQ